MSFKMNHIHLKTPDPEATAKFYVNTLGAMIVGKSGDNGFRLDLHGLSMNVTKHIESQTRDQVYGIEHIAIDTDDLDNVVASLKAGGAKILEETKVGNGRRVCFFEGPQGVQLEAFSLSRPRFMASMNARSIRTRLSGLSERMSTSIHASKGMAFTEVPPPIRPTL